MIEDMMNEEPVPTDQGSQPTQQYGANTNISNKYDRNQLNLAMRQQDWYQKYFTDRGLNPNMVKLSDGQRKELQALAVQNGFLDPSNGHIDPAGNVSDFHGWKGLPTAAKIAIGAGVTAATLGIGGVGTGGAGAFGMGGGGAGVGSAGLGTGLNAAMAGSAAHAAGGGLMMGTGGLVGAGAAAAGGTGATLAGLNGAPIVAGGTTATGGAASGAAGLGASVAPEVGIAGLNTGTLTSIPGVTTGTGAGVSGSGSLVSRMMDQQNWADTGKLLQNFGNDEANNRINNNSLRSNFETSRANLYQNHDNIQINAAANRRNDESDAMRKLNQASYIKSGGTPYDPSKVQLAGGRSLPSFPLPRAPISDEMKAGAASLEATLLDRLKNGSYTPADINSYLPSDPATNGAMNKGVGEQIGRYGSLAATGLGWYNNVFGK